MEQISIAALYPHPQNPREHLGDLTELAASIKEKGVLQNLTVIPGHYKGEDFVDSGYTIIIGHRRAAAARIAGLTELPCSVVRMTQKEQIETMLQENIQRADLTIAEQAQSFQLMIDLGSTVDEIAKSTGFSDSSIRRRLKIAELDMKMVKEAEQSRQLTWADFDKLSKLESVSERNALLDVIGTNNFYWKYNNAMAVQNAERNKPKVIKWLADRGITRELKQDELYGKVWTRTSFVYVNLSEKPDRLKDQLRDLWEDIKGKKDLWNNDKCKKDLAFHADSALFVYQKNDLPVQEIKKDPADAAFEKACKELERKVEAINMACADSRRRFMDEYQPQPEHEHIIFKTLFAEAVREHYEYYYKNDKLRNDIFGIDGSQGNTKDWIDKALTVIDGPNCLKAAAKMAAWLMGENYIGTGPYAGNGFVLANKQSYHKLTVIKNAKVERYDRIYAFYQALGYEMSDEEKQFQDGTHLIYKAVVTYKGAAAAAAKEE